MQAVAYMQVKEVGKQNADGWTPGVGGFRGRGEEVLGLFSFRSPLVRVAEAAVHPIPFQFFPIYCVLFILFFHSYLFRYI